MQKNRESKAKFIAFISLFIPFYFKVISYLVLLNLCLFGYFVLGCNTSSKLGSLPTWAYCCVIVPSGISCVIGIEISSHKRWVKLTRRLYLCSCETTTIECVENHMMYNCLWLILYDVKPVKFHVISSVIIYMLLLFIHICLSPLQVPCRLESLWVEMIHTRTDFRIGKNRYGLKW